MVENRELQIRRWAHTADVPPYRYGPDGRKQPLDETPEGRRALEEYLPRPLCAAEWTSCGAYLFGIDLFNSTRYWEAHEEWESLWVLAGRSGATADFLKGLIKLAAAGVKKRQNRLRGVARHAARAAELFEGVRGATRDGSFAGLSLDALIRESRALREYAEQGATQMNSPQHAALRFRLEPAPAKRPAPE